MSMYYLIGTYGDHIIDSGECANYVAAMEKWKVELQESGMRLAVQVFPKPEPSSERLDRPPHIDTPLNAMSDDQLSETLAYWDARIAAVDAWGALLTALDEARKPVLAEISWRITERQKKKDLAS